MARRVVSTLDSLLGEFKPGLAFLMVFLGFVVGVYIINVRYSYDEVVLTEAPITAPTPAMPTPTIGLTGTQ